MDHTCNLECWCHVPTRGTINPPCYLCVLQTCSLSTNEPDIAPSAPPINVDDEVHAPTLETSSLQTVVGAAYGWQSFLNRKATVNPAHTNNQNPEDLWMNPNLLVALPPEGDEGATGESVASPNDAVISESQLTTSASQIMEGCMPVSATEYTRRRRSRCGEDAQPLSEEPQHIHSQAFPDNRDDDYEIQKVHATFTYVDYDDEEEHYTGTKTKRSTKDLADSIKNLDLSNEDSSITNQWSSEPKFDTQEDSTPEMRNWLLANVYREKKNRNSTGFGSKLHTVHMSRNRHSPHSKSFSVMPLQEVEYKRINRIHHRESSAAACQRYKDQKSSPRQLHVQRLIALPWDDMESEVTDIPEKKEDLKAWDRAEKDMVYKARWLSLQSKLSGSNHNI